MKLEEMKEEIALYIDFKEENTKLEYF